MIKPLKTWDNNETNKHGDPNSPDMTVLNEYVIIGGAFLLQHQEDYWNITHDKIPSKTGEKSET